MWDEFTQRPFPVSNARQFLVYCATIKAFNVPNRTQKEGKPLSLVFWYNTITIVDYFSIKRGKSRGGVLPEKFGRGVRPASQNPYPIFDQNLRFSLPYL